MSGLWPWLAVAGVGALHGLNPATGWALVAAWGARSGRRARTWRALAPIALGHAGSVALVAALTALGMAAERGLLPWIAGGGAVFAAAMHVSGHWPGRAHHLVGQASLALWSLAVGTLHGAGMMLVPALVPLCVSSGPAREITATGSMGLALAAVALHMAALLATTAAMAAFARLGWRAMTCRPARAAVRPGVEAALVSVPRPCAAHPPATVPRVDRSPPPRRSPGSAGRASPAAPCRRTRVATPAGR
jgi:hypothetical protein